MILAFDFGGVLEVSTELQQMCRILGSAGVSLHVISAVAPGDDVRVRRAIERWGLQLTGIHFVFFSEVPTREVALRIGHQKAKIMQEIGASVLFDDNPHICEAVRADGLAAVQVTCGKRG